MTDHGAWELSHYVLESIWARPALLRVYRAVKSLVRLVTGTSELLRVVEGAARASNGDVVGSKIVYRIDRCLAHSAQLAAEWRELQTGKDLDLPALAKAIMTKKLFASPDDLTSTNARLLVSSLRSIRALHVLRASLLDLASQPVSLSDQECLDKLSSIYLALIGDKPPQSKHEDWKRLGFQGTDPSTDFRGSGQLGLDDLFAFATSQPGEALRSLEISQHPTAWFPWAVAGINITSYALGLLQSGKLDLELYRGGATKEASEGIFAYLFTIFARSWNERRGPERLTVLDFNRVFADIKTAFERDLSSGTGLAFASGSKKSN